MQQCQHPKQKNFHGKQKRKKDMMTLDEVRAKLADRRPRVVADAVGVSAQAVWRIRTGRTKAPSYALVKTLSDYLSLSATQSPTLKNQD
jgi:transcriptional regulator with XRE-family HTH domain